MHRCNLIWVGALVALVGCGNAKSVDDGESGAFSDIAFGGDVQFGKKDAAADAGDVGAADVPVDDSGFTDDVPAPDMDALSDATTATDATPDSTADAASDAIAETGCEFAAKPGAGEPGAPCSGNPDCDSGYCVDSPSGKICSQTCVSCCPTGFHCGQISGSSDSSYVCLAQFIALCRPCDTDAECGAVNAGALCISAGDEGSFCGGACAKNSDCPGGYGCQAVQGEKGAGQQCVRLSGTCGCSQKSIFDGATTQCKQSNTFGSCAGTRKCALSGLTACSAASPAQEVCNGKDDNCDGLTDGSDSADCVKYWKDGDGDGAGVGASQCLCAAVGLATATTNGDCDDDVKAVHPGAKEVCNDIDDTCDGATDEGCDDDGDGYCDAAMVIVGSPVVCTYGTKDCNDGNASVHPSAPEICGNGVDDDCNGVTDDNASTTFYLDSDGDGFGNGKVTQQACAKPAGFVAFLGDCDDNAATAHPGAAEICDGLDNDCDGATDGVDIGGCKVLYTDGDSDGAGAGVGSCVCKATGTLTATGNGDCDDGNPDAHPGATEVCNGIDDNCNSVTDEEDAINCAQFFPDADGDGYGAIVTGHCLCAADGVNKVKKSGDCNDGNAAIHPKADEACNGVDDNCDSIIDPMGAEGCNNYYVDGDGDGFGTTSGGSKCQCAASGVYAALVTGDCDDGVKTTYPGATELCNGADDNCNGDVDEGVTTLFYVDADKDGYGAAAISVAACSAPPGYVTDNTDCDGSKASVHPGATETCNGVDDNCDNVTDGPGSGGCTTYFTDADLDGAGAKDTLGQCLCAASAPYTATSATDCNDAVAAIHPGATEVCNGVDDNCDGFIDETGLATFYQDADKDGFGSAVTVNACSAPTGYVSLTGDCDDTLASVHPGAVEKCNTLDDNCNSQIDEGVKLTFYLDFDGDGYGDNNQPTQACTAPTGYVSDHTDCDDVHAYAHPGGKEICNYVDDDCNGAIDDGVTTTYYQDNDGDTFGNSNVPVKACNAPLGNVAVGGDCNDNNAAIYPGAQEVCDGVDNNCVNGIDEGLTTVYYTDADGDGYGTGTGTAQCTAGNGKTATQAGDCNDITANGGFAIHPSAAEVCNGIDDNCNNLIDDTLTFKTYYQDNDGDLYGNPAASKSACSQTAGYVLDNTDCNDTTAAAHPGLTETCGAGNAPNGVDENCAGGTDETCTAVACVASTQVDFTGGKGSHGFSLGNGWVQSLSGGEWGGAPWVIVYSKEPNPGYLKNGGTATGTNLNVPAGTKSVQVDVPAFYNIAGCTCNDNNCANPADTTIKLRMTVTGTGVSSYCDIGPFGTSMYQAGLKTCKAAMPANWAGGSVTIDLTISGAADNNVCYWGGIAVSKIEGVCN